MVKVLFPVVVVIGIGLAVWMLMQQVSPNVARVWALLTSLLVIGGWPVMFALGSRYGHAEGQGATAGLELGIAKVNEATTKTIDLRGAAIRSRMDSMQPAIVVNPPIIEAARQLSGGDAIEML